jgi:lipid II:glycine glycyltransferase (peptidoglycan interpeptide bridge formation enzyme)
MWERLSKTRQKQIRRAMRSGVEVIEPVEEDVKKWYAILQEMYRQKVKLPLLPMDFFLNAYRSGNAKYLMVKYKGEVIGGLMFEMDEKSVYEWYVCGLDSAYERQYPSVVATYAGMEYANAHGRKCCDLMGAGEPGVPYGVRDFKERFGGQLVEHGRFVCVREPILYKIGVLGVKIMKGA